MNMKSILGYVCAMVVACFLTPTISAQPIIVDDTFTIEELVNEILLGDGVAADNITYNGEPGDIVSLHNGFFDAIGTNFLIEEGVVMATSGINIINGMANQTENFQNDPDLVAISGFNMNNCAVIEFEFTADSDSIVFEYIFASEEYPGFTCSSFNDAFGFFLSGPGISGPYTSPAGYPDGSANIALIPNSDVAVGVNSVNSGVPSGGNPQNCLNANPNFVEDSQYFIPNDPPDPNSIQIRGHTVVLTARAAIQCGETYHIKLAIGNASDQALQSAVFLKKGSFSAAGQVFVDVVPSLPGIDISGTDFADVVVAGCFSPLIELTRPPNAPLGEIFVTYSGTAIEGVDYILGDNDTLFAFSDGVDTLFYNLTTFANPNAADTIFIDINVIFEACGGLDTVTASIPMIQPYTFNSETENVVVTCPADSVVIEATGLNGVGPYTYDWIGHGFGQATAVPVPPDEEWFVVAITDQCEFGAIFDSVLVVNNIPPPLALELPDVTEPLCPTMPVTLNALVEGGNGDYFFNWSPVPSPDESVIVNFPASQMVYLTVTDTCGTQRSDSVFVSYPEYDDLVISLDLEKHTCPVNPLAFRVDHTGGAGGNTYIWTLEDGDGRFTEPDMEETLFSPEPGLTVVALQVIDQCFIQGFQGPYIGAADAEDTLKTIDLSRVPNVMTPNGDRRNDWFAVEGLEIFPGTNFEVWNRWGTSIFQSDNYTVGDIEGNSSNAFTGEGHDDGSYFYILNVNAGECVKTGYLQLMGTNIPRARR